MEIKISSRQMAVLNRNAKNVYPQVIKLESLKAKRDALNAEIEQTEGFITAIETGSRLVTGGVKNANNEVVGGFNSFEVIRREVVTTDKLDEAGKPIKKTVFSVNPQVVIENPDGTFTLCREDAPAEPAQPAAEGGNDSDPDNDSNEQTAE